MQAEDFVYVYRYLDRFTRRNNKETAKVIVYLTPFGEVDNEEFMNALSLFGNILQNSFRKKMLLQRAGLIVTSFFCQSIVRMMKRWLLKEFGKNGMRLSMSVSTKLITRECTPMK